MISPEADAVWGEKNLAPMCEIFKYPQGFLANFIRIYPDFIPELILVDLIYVYEFYYNKPMEFEIEKRVCTTHFLLESFPAVKKFVIFLG